MQLKRLALPLLLAGTVATNVALLAKGTGTEDASSGNAHAATDLDVALSVSRAFREVSERVTPSIAAVSTRRLRGSGVLLSDTGLIVTNHHVVARAERCRVELYDGREFIARVIGSDPETDIALLHVDGKGLPSIELSEEPPPAIGTWVLAIGNPLGFNHTVTFGIISARGREPGLRGVVYEDFLQTDAAINAGNSGGALVDLDGRLVGINTAKEVVANGSQGLGFAIPAYLVREVVQELLEKGYVERGFFGIQVEQLEEGLRVTSVTAQSPANEAGFQLDDIVLEIGGVDVPTRRKLFATIARLDPGSKVAVDILRSGERDVLLVEVGERRPVPR